MGKSVETQYGTFSLFSTAYVSLAKVLTHVVEYEVGNTFRPVRVLCGRVLVKNVHPDGEETAAATCKVCARRDPRGKVG
jgi:hypothetical protein